MVVTVEIVISVCFSVNMHWTPTAHTISQRTQVKENARSCCTIVPPYETLLSKNRIRRWTERLVRKLRTGKNENDVNEWMNELATSEKWERPGVGSRNPSSIEQRIVWEFVVALLTVCCWHDYIHMYSRQQRHSQTAVVVRKRYPTILQKKKRFFFWRRDEQLEDRNSLKPLDVSVFLAYVEVFVSRSNVDRQPRSKAVFNIDWQCRLMKIS